MSLRYGERHQVWRDVWIALTVLTLQVFAFVLDESTAESQVGAFIEMKFSKTKQ
jgi:hypothetical protein